MQKFKSRIGAAFYIPIGFLFIMLGFAAVTEPSWALIGITGFMAVMVSPMAFRTYYTVSDDLIRIRCGFYKQTVALQSVRKLSASRDIISAPALSLDRIEIMYHKFDTVLVSPEDQAGFVSCILQINPDIEICSVLQRLLQPR